MMAEDSVLLRRYVENRDETAFAELVRRYLNLVYFAALRQVAGDSHRAEDVTQIVFTRLVRKAPALTSHQSLAGWLHTTTRFAASEARRAERRRLAREQEAHVMHELSANPAAHADWEQLGPVIDEALNDLGDADREAVLLRFFANLSYAEVGTQLNLSENTARMRVERALDKLQVRLARRGVTTTAASLGAVMGAQEALVAPAGLAGMVTSAALAESTGSGALAGGVAFMSTVKITGAALAALLLVAALSTALSESRVTQSAEEALGREVAADDALRSALARRREAVDAAQRQRAELKAQVEQLRAKAKTASIKSGGTPAIPSEPPWDPIAAGHEYMTRHPEIKTAIDEYGRARVRFKYGKLYRELNLTQPQIDEFEKLVSAGVGMGAQGPDYTKQLTFMAGDSNTLAMREQRMRELLGEEGYRKFLEHSSVATASDLAAGIAGSLWHTETPLTPQQSDALVEILLKNRIGRSNRFEWEQVLRQAAGILSEPQLAILEGRRVSLEFSKILSRPPNSGPAPTK